MTIDQEVKNKVKLMLNDSSKRYNSVEVIKEENQEE